MSESEKDKAKEIEGHSYDGITEYDHPLPNWWLWTFFLTIIFSFLYYLHYEVGGGPTLKQELASAMGEIEKNQAHEPHVLETEEALEKAMSSKEGAASGAIVFAGKCAVCHGDHLQGQIGPNLTDSYWIHGKGTRLDLVKVIREGVSDKGMPPWGQILSKDEVYGVAAFILSQKGSNPANAKAPQGERVE